MSITIILALLLLIIIVVVLVTAVSVKRNDITVTDERSVEMVKTVYIYVILLATLMMVIGGSVGAFMAIADIISPQPYFQTFEEYSRMPQKVPDQVTDQQKTMSKEELQQNYQIIVNQEKQRARGRAVNSLIKSFGWIIVPLPVFIYYQRKVKGPFGSK